jgi:HSF-type DNA-binding
MSGRGDTEEGENDNQIGSANDTGGMLQADSLANAARAEGDPRQSYPLQAGAYNMQGFASYHPSQAMGGAGGPGAGSSGGVGGPSGGGPPGAYGYAGYPAPHFNGMPAYSSFVPMDPRSMANMMGGPYQQTPHMQHYSAQQSQHPAGAGAAGSNNVSSSNNSMTGSGGNGTPVGAAAGNNMNSISSQGNSGPVGDHGSGGAAAMAPGGGPAASAQAFPAGMPPMGWPGANMSHPSFARPPFDYPHNQGAARGWNERPSMYMYNTASAGGNIGTASGGAPHMPAHFMMMSHHRMQPGGLETSGMMQPNASPPSLSPSTGRGPVAQSPTKSKRKPRGDGKKAAARRSAGNNSDGEDAGDSGNEEDDANQATTKGKGRKKPARKSNGGSKAKAMKSEDDDNDDAADDDGDDNGSGGDEEVRKGSRGGKSGRGSRGGDGTREYAETFPEKLHRLLIETEAEGRGHIASFMPSGKSFRINDRKAFLEDIAPMYFRIMKFSSFKRQLYLYDFQFVENGEEQGCYFHPNFDRDNPDGLHKVRRVTKGYVARAMTKKQD